MTPKPLELFDALRIDPAKARDGAWIQHPETGDRFRVRRWGCEDHLKAFVVAEDDYDQRHGEGASKDQTAVAELEAISMATGLIVDWELAGAKERPYDAAQMAAALSDPTLVDLRDWIVAQARDRDLFRPEAEVHS